MTQSLSSAFDRANPNTLADGFRIVKLGQTLKQDVKQTRRNVNMDAAGAAPEDLATVDSLALPDDAKAMTILRAYARAGSAGSGELNVDPPNITPGTTDIAVSPAGNIVTIATDGHTDLDVEYIPARGDVVEVTGPVATGVFTIPAGLVATGVLLLLRGELTAGSVLGRKIVLAPAAGLPATTQVRLDVAKATVQFNSATDAGTQATVRLLVAAGADLTSLLDASSDIT